ncbi:serine carboxypeptidase [Aureococcus anophagefferens]|nr:serine carboxypeptidase [Aureococcus anophagefferens]
MASKAAPVVASALAALALTAALLRQGPAVALSQLATTDAAPQEQSTTTNFLSDDALALAGEIASERGMEDLVTVLPGANFVNSFATFSGYLDVSDTKKTFYWFVTARDASKAKDKPVVMWTNGGPGCSGLIGFWTEMGPWRATEDMTIEPFDFAWNKEANMLFIESPTGVGFSTSNKDADFDAGDWSTAKDNFELLKHEMKYYALNYSDWPESITGDMECAELTAAMFDAIGDVDYYGLDFPVCNKAQGLEYLNKAEVKNAIHANASLLWAECSLPDTLRYNYDDMNLFMEPVWKKLIEAKLHLLVFSGDDDSICGPIGTQDWLARLADEMGLSDAGETWQAWYYVDPEYGDGQVGGYRVKYQSSDGDMAIAFATVHHAGHEVPMYQPMKGLRGEHQRHLRCQSGPRRRAAAERPGRADGLPLFGAGATARRVESMDFLFSKPQFNCIGDPYKDPPMDPYKHGTSKGRRQFLTAPPKKGQTANAIGYGPLAYKPMRGTVAGKGKFLTPNGFTYASPMKKSASPGDMCGTFNKTPVEHLPDGRDDRPPSKVDVDVIARRNIQTSPGKRGGFGVAGTLIGGNPEYVHSSYTAYDDKIRADMRKHREIMGERRPFTSTTRTMDFFDSHDHCSASKIYSNEGFDFPPPKDRPLRPKTSEEGEEMRVFRPSSPAKVGYNGTLNAFPEALAEPFDDRERRRAQLPQRRQPIAEGFKGLSDAIRERKPFRPTSGPRSGVTRPMCIVGAWA